MDKLLVSRLSVKSSQVLLSLLLTRELENQPFEPEFASLELETTGLITIIAQGVKDVAERPMVANSDSVVKAISEEGSTEDGRLPGRHVEEAPVVNLLDWCRQADAAKDKQMQLLALYAVWNDAFPLPEYEYAQLSPDFAKKLLANGRPSIVAAEIIQDAVAHARGSISSPRAYITKAVESYDKKAAERDARSHARPINETEEDEVDMNLMRQMALAWKGQQ